MIMIVIIVIIIFKNSYRRMNIWRKKNLIDWLADDIQI